MSDNTKQQIRCIISNVYDLQKLRISAGNRLVQSFYISLGIEPSTSPEDADKDEKRLIDVLRKEYARITDGIAENNMTVKRQIKMFNESKNVSDHLTYIRDEMDYRLMDSYMLLLKSEENAVKVLDKYVRQHPLWGSFFEPIKGCGTLMSAVCIAYIDITKAKYVSSLYRYCGLDTVQDEDKDGNKLFLRKINGQVMPGKVREKFYYLTQDGETYTGTARATEEFDSDGNQIYLGEGKEVLTKEFAFAEVDGQQVPVYEDIETLAEYIGDVVASEHGRRKGDTEMFEFVDKDGVKKMKRGITYNPVVKTKLMGVLTGCLLKAKDPVYSKIYYDYRARLDKSPKHKDYTSGHKNMMAQHYMIKQFLRNLYKAWRELEGLPVYEPYEVGVLGIKPHHC